MKNWTSAALAALLLAALGCSNDLNLAAPWKDIPVVYGFIDRLDTAHYVRVEKAFLDSETSALTIAKNPDSLYYSNVSVYFERKNGQRYPLERVDGALEGYLRDTGIFAQAPNILYKIRRNAINLQAGEDLKIVVERGDNLPIDTAVTQVVSDILLWSPSVASTNGIQLKPDDFFTIRFQPGAESIVFDIKATIHVKEITPANPTGLPLKTIDWPIVRGISRTNEIDEEVIHKFSSNSFYSILNQNLAPLNDPLAARYISAIDFRIDAGAKEIKEYNDLLLANTGLPGAELIPVYTNMSEGFGLFTSRGFSVFSDFRINQATRDWLMTNESTKALNFK